jgi:hypothetical protein
MTHVFRCRRLSYFRSCTQTSVNTPPHSIQMQHRITQSLPVWYKWQTTDTAGYASTHCSSLYLLKWDVSNKHSRHTVQLFTLYVVCQLWQNSCGLGEELLSEQATVLPECLQSSIHRALSCRCTTLQHMLWSNNPTFGNILDACFDMAVPSSGRTREVKIRGKAVPLQA